MLTFSLDRQSTPSEDASSEGAHMDELELLNSGEIRNFVSSKLKDLLDSYSILTVGHITKFLEPISANVGISEALQLFASREDANSLPVEGENGVIGIVQKQDLLKKKTALMSVTDPSIERFVDRSTFSVDASENCEKAMSLIFQRDPESLYDDFMI